MAARLRLRKNFLATLMLAQGVPMLLAGDEVGNSQSGNNNAYCQDNETGWVKWTEADGEQDLTDFVARLTDLRRQFAPLRAKDWLKGRLDGGGHDILWLTPSGAEMTAGDWEFPNARFVSYVLNPPEGTHEALFVVLNGSSKGIEVSLPKQANGRGWVLRLDTSDTTLHRIYGGGSTLVSPACSVLAFSSAP